MLANASVHGSVEAASTGTAAAAAPPPAASKPKGAINITWFAWTQVHMIIINGRGVQHREGLIFASFCLLKEGGIYPTGYPAEKLSYEGERMLWKNKAIYLVGYCFQDALDVLFIQLISNQWKWVELAHISGVWLHLLLDERSKEVLGVRREGVPNAYKPNLYLYGIHHPF